MPGAAGQKIFQSAFVSDGTNHIHFGIRSTVDDRVSDTLHNTVQFLYQWCVRSGANFGPGSRVLDIGAGMGGSAHFLASKTGSSVTCVDTSEEMTTANRTAIAKFSGDAAKLVEAVVGSCTALPAEWTGQFDVVWALDAIGVCGDKQLAINETFRVCKPGGVVMICDAVRSPKGTAETTEPYRTYAGLSSLWSLHEYEMGCERAGLEVLRTRDLSAHAMQFHKLVMKQAKEGREKTVGLTAKQVDEGIAKIEKLVRTLDENNAHGWGATVAYKAVGDGSGGKLSV